MCYLEMGGVFVFYELCLAPDLFINYLLFILFMSCCIFVIVYSGLVVTTERGSWKKEKMLNECSKAK